MISGVNIISRKVSISSVNGAGASGGGGALSPSAGVLGGRAALRTFLGSKEQESLSESMAGFCIYL